MRDVRIVSRSGDVLTADDTLMPFGLTHRNDALGQDMKDLSPVFGEGGVSIDVGAPATTVEEEVIFIGGRANFGHIFYETLPRLAVARRFHDLRRTPVVVFDTFPERLRGLLALCGVPAENVRVVPAGPTIAMPRAIVPSCALYRGYVTDKHPYVWPEAYLFLREMGRRFAGDPKAGRRVYLLRSGARWRRPADEAAIEAAEGFEIVVPETLPIEEQVRIVSETRTLVTPLGAVGMISVHLPRGAAIIASCARRSIMTRRASPRRGATRCSPPPATATSASMSTRSLRSPGRRADRRPRRIPCRPTPASSPPLPKWRRASPPCPRWRPPWRRPPA
ncbi:MAG: glycosyltransferase family 61 protein [Rhodospirillales bacterium]|jgi:capsular polysaccharide biosynthesis protein